MKESAVQKRGQWLPDIDFMDCQVRQENLNIRGEPIMLQLPLVPAYALTVHKTQALSIKHLVLGCVGLSSTRALLHAILLRRVLKGVGVQQERRRQCVTCVVEAGCVCERERDKGCNERGLEGVFAQGHVYVCISRVTDPATQRKHK